MCDELNEELEIGDRIARGLVEHVQRMGAACATFTVIAQGGRLDGQEFEVIARIKTEPEVEG